LEKRGGELTEKSQDKPSEKIATCRAAKIKGKKRSTWIKGKHTSTAAERQEGENRDRRERRDWGALE